MLSVYVESFAKAIAFQVVSQSTEITDFIKKNGTFHASNGWNIAIDNAPELDIASKTIYLRGSDVSQNKRVDRTWDLSTNSRRDDYVRAVDQALNDLVLAVTSATYLLFDGRPTTSGSAKHNTPSNKPLIRQ